MAVISPASTPDPVPASARSASGFTGPPRRPPTYAKALTAFFFIAPLIALAALILDAGSISWWWMVALTVALVVIFGHGVTIGFHRLFAHRSFVANRFLKNVLAALGTLAFQGSVIGWVADHRRHHRFSDVPGDPHSPYWKDDQPLRGLRGLWHAHLGWCFNVDATSREAYAADLLADRDLVRIDQLFVPLAIATFAIPFAVGYAWTGSLRGAWAGLLCAGFVRIGITLNATWSVNSICHRFGRRPFATRDRSRNFAPLAILTMGESWHNNHHAFPRSARHGLGRGQTDSSARLIRWFEQLGWASDVNWPDKAKVADRLVGSQ